MLSPDCYCASVRNARIQMWDQGECEGASSQRRRAGGREGLTVEGHEQTQLRKAKAGIFVCLIPCCAPRI